MKEEEAMSVNGIGPTFVCEFSDGTITRMTTHCPKGLDLVRGIKLSRAAYESRRRKPAPDILSGRFEDDRGAVLEVYNKIACLGLSGAVWSLGNKMGKNKGGSERNAKKNVWECLDS